MNENDLDNTTGKNHTGHRANEPLRILTASSITGDKVFNPSGERLGKIFDIMLNLESGKIEYIIIAFGGFLGIGQKYFAIPFVALTIDPDKHAFIFNQSRKAFENHPGFNKHHWPEANFHSQFSGSYGGFMGPNTGADH
jgi:sporulation protein YlmC with PRC-barrel domain